MIRLACFDLDGTLLDTLEGIASASNKALCALDLPVWPMGDYRAFIGYGPHALAQHILPAGQLPSIEDRWLHLYKQYYLTDCTQRAQPFPGVLKALQTLRASGVRLAVLSNKPDELVQAQISSCFSDLFEAVCGQREGEPVKPDPTALLYIANEFGLTPSECAYVGDMLVDIKTACNAGFTPVGVLWGFGSDSLADSAGSFALVECAKELPRVLFDLKT